MSAKTENMPAPPIEEPATSDPDAPDATPDITPDAAARFRGRLDYQIIIDLEHAYYDAEGRLHLRGEFFNRGLDSIRLGKHATGTILIGARVLQRSGLMYPGREARANIATPVLLPGRGASFRLRLPAFDPVVGDFSIEVALVCEGQFWFNDVGFPSATLSLAGEQYMKGLRDRT